MHRQPILNRDSPQANGLAYWWPMEPSGGLKLYDLAGRGQHGTLTNGPTWVGDTTSGGHALSFDGLAAYVEGAASLGVTHPLTLTAWVYLGAAHTGSILYVGQSGEEWGLLMHSSGQVWALSQSGGGNNQSTIAVSSGQWCHVAGVFTASNLRQVYLNGVPGTADTNTRAVAPSSTPCRLGLRYSDLQRLNGVVRDARVYNTAVPAPVLMQMYDPATRFDLFRSTRRPRQHLNAFQVNRVRFIDLQMAGGLP